MFVRPSFLDHFLTKHLCVLACAQDKVPAEVADIGFKQAMQQKWLGMDKSGGAPRIVRKVGVVRWRALGG